MEKKQSVSYRIAFNNKGKLNKKGEGLVTIIAYSKSENRKKVFNTGVSIKPDDWDKQKQVVSKNHFNYIALNNKIKDVVEGIRNIELRCMADDIPFTLATLELQDNRDRKLYNSSFTEFFISQIKTNNRISNKAKENEMGAYQYFREYAGNKLFSEMTHSVIVNFDNYLRRPDSPLKSDFSIYDKHKVLKKYVKEAILLKYIDANEYPYQNFQLKQGKSNRVGLNADEIRRIENFDANYNIRLTLTKDLFLFSCFTGIRWGDLIELNKYNLIKEGEDTNLDFIAKKTGTRVILPLNELFNGKPISLLNKYIDKDRNELFPSLGNKYVNENLKIIAAGAQIKINLTFHLSRHTFGSRLAELKPDPYLIKKLMGHQDIKTSMIYIETSQKTIKDKLKGINWK